MIIIPIFKNLKKNEKKNKKNKPEKTQTLKGERNSDFLLSIFRSVSWNLIIELHFLTLATLCCRQN